VPVQSDLGEIGISEDVNLLSEVVVTSRRPLVVQQLDRTVVNVAGNIITSGLNVQGLLKQLPGLIVDKDGTVTLNGRPATIYIDGRPTNLPPEQAAQMLNGMMGDMVDRVELIDNPSSRYEAEISAAIVNIRLKHDASPGLNGTVQAGAGFAEYDFASHGGLNLNYHSKKLNIFRNYGYDNLPHNYDLFQIRNFGGAVPLTYDQHSESRARIPTHTLRAGVDWFVSPEQTIGFLFNGTSYKLDIDVVSEAAVS